MRQNIFQTSQLLQNRTQLHTLDYRAVLGQAQISDVIYMDPPYQGVCKNQDPRYVRGLAFDEFVETLQDLNGRNLSFIVSYDGRTGTKTYGNPLPESLDLRHIEIDAGRVFPGDLIRVQPDDV